jgi:hypothetical protein
MALFSTFGKTGETEKASLIKIRHKNIKEYYAKRIITGNKEWDFTTLMKEEEDSL